jgi:hypothetical protein
LAGKDVSIDRQRGTPKNVDAISELLVILAIVMLPTAPASLYLAAALRRRRARPETTEVATGRAPETPFVLIATVGTVIASVAALAVALTLLARAVA